MNTKERRLEVIKQIVQTEIIRNQEDLLRSLLAKGYEATQATLSRDIRQLKIVKTPDADNQYVYTLSENIRPETEPDEGERMKIEFSGSLAVVKTRPGYAMGIASDIDQHAPREILGTIAGDDTILIIPREGYDRGQIAGALAQFID
ncbi:MAG: ArgR family transcriptional regulator [Tannerella sp.]|jgi:transcriptional regulator of arginine metabolism|nr:ArgR family transcriptional regulator [Tannerella sp.]